MSFGFFCFFFSYLNQSLTLSLKLKCCRLLSLIWVKLSRFFKVELNSQNIQRKHSYQSASADNFYPFLDCIVH